MNPFIDIKSYLTFLSKNKGYTAINVFGLSISLMFVILIAVYTGQEISVDKFQRNADRIYALGNEEDIGAASRIGYAMQEMFPEIEKVCPVISNHTGELITVGDEKYRASFLFADSCFFDFFSFELVDGNKSRVLEAKNHVVISESFSKKAFPGKNPVGELILLIDSIPAIINGVMKDIRNSTIPYADMVLRIETISHYNPSAYRQFSNVGAADVFLLAREGADLPGKTGAILELFKKIYWIYRDGIWEKVSLTPLNKLYFSEIQSWQLNHGDKSFVLIFLSVGLLILVFAIINYINLTVAQAGFRAKEMAMRRLLGSSRKELFVRLIAESTLLCVVSFGLGLLFARLAVPYVNDLLNTTLYLTGGITVWTVGAMLLLVLSIGFVSGFLPATIMSNATPIEVVRGDFRQRTKMVFSKFFIIFQHTLTITMIAVAMIMVTQVNHLIHAPLNYNNRNILDIAPIGDSDDLRVFGHEISHLACVKSVGYTEGTPFNRGNNSTVFYKDKKKSISFQILVSDQATFDMLQLKKRRENHIASEGYYLNQQALKELELTEEATTFEFATGETLIAGILEDFQLNNITSKKEPLLYQIVKNNDVDPWQMLVEVQGNPFEAYREIASVYKRMSGLEIRAEYLETQVKNSYERQYRASQLITLFTGIAMLVSFLGLLAMSTYFIQQRSREIAIRKVFGSTGKQVLKRLVITFLYYVLIAFAVATPVAWILMRDWLAGYEYRISLSPVYFILAGLFCGIISLATVFIQSWYAANENPVKRLKTD